MTRTTTMNKCRQAKEFWRVYHGAANRDEVLKELHAACPGTIKLLSKDVTVVCNCECHKAGT